MRKLLAVLMLGLLPLAVHAGEAKPLAKDPAVEKRMVALAQNLRCLVCQNESLAASQADLAKDLREEVREKIKQGMTDKQITDYLVARYGDFVLYDPPMKRSTVLLWFGPFALLLVGIGVLFYQLRKRRRVIPETELTADAHQRAAALLNDQEDNQA